MKNDENVHKQLCEIGKELKIKEHFVTNRAVMSAFCGDLEVHKFDVKNNSYYFILDTARIFPPAVSSQRFKRVPHGSIFFRMLRPELVKKSLEPLSSDAFSMWQEKDQREKELNNDVRKATDMLLKIIKEFGEQIANDSHQIEAIVTPSLNRIKNPEFTGTPIQDPIIREIHERGINLRYLGLLINVIHEKKGDDKLINYLVGFIIARSVKNFWRENIRKTENKNKTTYEICLDFTINVMNNMLKLRKEEKNQEDTQFWGKSLWNSVSRMFADGLLVENENKNLKKLYLNSLGMSLENSKMKPTLNLSWVIINFCELCGISLTPASVAAVIGKEYFEFSRADIKEYITVIKYPPILIYYTGLYYYYKGQKTQITKTKLSFMKNAVSRLVNVVGYPFQNVREQYATASLEILKLDSNFVCDIHFVIRTFSDLLVEYQNKIEGKENTKMEKKN